ncbi:MAG: NAD(P)/FAD-dependent oxidoreductase [Ignavibacteriae bacterium]|nr:NAD(P)/FAD-dependent oxidoreductase [Ignavibacteriota bacterium]
MTEKHIIIIGAGFGGIHAAKELLKGGNELRITLIDARNFHLFQPLLYQVATAQLSPEDIAYPIRSIFKNNKNLTVLKERVSAVDLDKRCVKVERGNLFYDKLIISVGVTPDYFGNDNWKDLAPPLKTLEDALKVRRRILNVFERIEAETLHPEIKPEPLNFVIIGAGPTGIELAGALAELSKHTLKNEFRKISPERAKIFLIEAGPDILPGFKPKLIKSAEKSLMKLGVTIKENARVTNIDNDKVEVKIKDSIEIIESKVVLWTAGVKAYFGNDLLSSKEKIPFDRKGRVEVNKDLTIPNYNDVYVIGDFAIFKDENNKPIPGTAPPAMQQGTYAAKHIKGTAKEKFKYFDKGSLAVIGRNEAVADFGKFQITGFPAWILWVFVHIGYLVGFNNRLFVMIKWAWNYIVRKSTARIIYTNYNKK